MLPFRKSQSGPSSTVCYLSRYWSPNGNQCWPGFSGSNRNPKPVSPNWLHCADLCVQSSLLQKVPLPLRMGMESQLHGPSTFSYQGEGAPFGQINPLLRSLWKSRLFSWETIYPLINRGKFKSPKSLAPRQIFIFEKKKSHYRPIATNHWDNFQTHTPTYANLKGHINGRLTGCCLGATLDQQPDSGYLRKTMLWVIGRASSS